MNNALNVSQLIASIQQAFPLESYGQGWDGKPDPDLLPWRAKLFRVDVKKEAGLLGDVLIDMILAYALETTATMVTDEMVVYFLAGRDSSVVKNQFSGLTPSQKSAVQRWLNLMSSTVLRNECDEELAVAQKLWNELRPHPETGFVRGDFFMRNSF